MSTTVNVTVKNKRLMKLLLSKGFYVKAIGQQDEIDYLIVSCNEPKK